MNKFYKFLVVFLLTVLLINSSIGIAKAETESSNKIATSSYELFWPLASGKTMDDSLYFLKSTKENIIGFFKFNADQKADYDVYLAVKRLLEGEKLLKQSKKEFAGKTFDFTEIQLSKANKIIKDAKKEEILASTKMQINDRLRSIKALTSILEVDADGSIKEKLEKIRNESQQLLDSL